MATQANTLGRTELLSTRKESSIYVGLFPGDGAWGRRSTVDLLCVFGQQSASVLIIDRYGTVPYSRLEAITPPPPSPLNPDYPTMQRLGPSLVSAMACLALATAPAAAARPSSNCTSSRAAHIIVARESGAPDGVSVMNLVAEEVAARCSGSDMAGVPYPAEFSPYAESEGYGVGNLTEMVLAYQADCPRSKIVLMGYSQVNIVCSWSSLYRGKMEIWPSESVVSRCLCIVFEEQYTHSYDPIGRTSRCGFPLRHLRVWLPGDGRLCQ